MTNFYVLNEDGKKQGTAVNAQKATEVLTLIFPGQKAFVVQDNKVPFAQNMTIAEAEDTVGIKHPEPVAVTSSIEVLPQEEPVKKARVRSKIVVKNKPKAKKSVVKPKAKKPAAKKKPVKKPVAKKNVKKK